MKAITHLQNVWLNVFEIRIYRSSRRSVAKRLASESIQDRAIRIRESQATFEFEQSELSSFEFRPGIVFSPFLFGPGRQIALLAARALTYSPKNQQYEKRLARYLSWQWRVKAAQLDYLRPYTVRTLLQAIALKTDKRFPNRTKKRLEDALNRLSDDGILRTWQYDNDRSERKKVRWLGDWLDSTILVEPPQTIFDRYRKIQARGEVVDFGELAERLKEKRLQAQLSVLGAAEQSGVSAPDYLFAEYGRRPPVNVRTKLEKWLHSSTAS